MPSERVDVVTTLFGHDENEDMHSSAIPWLLDEYFHGDFKVNRPESRSQARGSKQLEEYSESFPDYRMCSTIEIEFNSDGQTISESTVRMTNPGEPNTLGGVSSVTLEGGSDEPENPFRTTLDYDGSDDFLKATVKGPHIAQEKVGPIGDDGIEGMRASLILGRSDPYLKKMKEDGVTLADLVGADIPAAYANYMAHVTTFYSFIDFVYMADGSIYVRVWDASVYPAHALYVRGEKEDQSVFREGDEWVTQGPIEEHDAFLRFGFEGNAPGITPFDQGGSWAYKDLYTQGSGPHPVMEYIDTGPELSQITLNSEFSEPLFPDSLGLF